VVLIPKYRRKALFGNLRPELGKVFRELARRKECEIDEGHLAVDPVHMLISIPPKHAVSQVVGYIKGKSAIHIARNFGGRKRNFVGQHFWASGYFVSTVGRDEERGGPTSAPTKLKVSESINWACCNAVPFRGTQGSLSGPRPVRFERLTFFNFPGSGEGSLTGRARRLDDERCSIRSG
jgi:putative transposase